MQQYTIDQERFIQNWKWKMSVLKECMSARLCLFLNHLKKINKKVTAEKTKRCLNKIKMTFWRESIVVIISFLNNNKHYLGWSYVMVESAVHREITNLSDSGGKKFRGTECVCMCVDVCVCDSW